MKAEAFVRVLFDACISKLLVKDLADFLAREFPNVGICHVLDTFKPGTHDGRWLDWLTSSTKDSRVLPLVITANRSGYFITSRINRAEEGKEKSYANQFHQGLEAVDGRLPPGRLPHGLQQAGIQQQAGEPGRRGSRNARPAGEAIVEKHG
jgi:hypothetical protein